MSRYCSFSPSKRLLSLAADKSVCLMFQIRPDDEKAGSREKGMGATMLHLCTLLAQLTDEQRGEQFGAGLVKLIVIAIAIVGVIVWLKRRGSSND